MLLYNDPRHLSLWGGTTLGLALFAIGVRVWLEPDGPETLSGGSQVGLIYGLLGGGIVIFCWLLAALRFVPSWWFIGCRAFWLKGHIWLGLLSFVLVLCHSGLRFGGWFEQLLYLVFFLATATGIAGLILQQFLPRWLTIEVPCEVPYEQIPNVCVALRAKADRVVDGSCGAAPPATRERIKRWYDEVVRPFLEWPSREPLLADASKTTQIFAQMRALPGADQEDAPIKLLLSRLEEYCNERRRLARQENLHRMLHGWLYLHVPLSAAMLVMMIAHALMTLYY
ncbi:MAG: hypothetical protein HYX68_07415 [Planctomycetes bacterium]|nr:hypothetical protein [Planctomycetota bacterium]